MVDPINSETVNMQRGSPQAQRENFLRGKKIAVEITKEAGAGYHVLTFDPEFIRESIEHTLQTSFDHSTKFRLFSATVALSCLWADDAYRSETQSRKQRSFGFILSLL